MKFSAPQLVSAVALLAASGFAMQAQAHCLTQSITAGANSQQHDVYLFNCPAGTKSVYARVGLISGAAVTEQTAAASGGSSSVVISDAGASAGLGCRLSGQDGVAYEHLNPANNPSNYVSYTTGAGVNSLVASKNAAGSSNYGIEFHCMNGAAGSATPQGSEVTTANYELSTVIDALDVVTDTNVDANLPINN